MRMLFLLDTFLKRWMVILRSFLLTRLLFSFIMMSLYLQGSIRSTPLFRALFTSAEPTHLFGKREKEAGTPRAPAAFIVPRTRLGLRPCTAFPSSFVASALATWGDRQQQPLFPGRERIVPGVDMSRCRSNDWWERRNM